MRFWEYSPWSQNTSRTVYLSSLMVRQHQVFCVPEAPRVLEGFLGFCLYRVVMLCTVGSVSLSQCSLHIPADGESLPQMTHGRIAVTTLLCPPPARTCSGSGTGLCNGSLSCVCPEPLKHHLWAFLASVQPIPSQAPGCAFLNVFVFVTQQPPCCAYSSENWVEFHGLMLCRRTNKVTSRKL